MKFHYPGINCVFDITDEYVNALIVEHQPLFLSVISDLYQQTQGNDGISVLSEKDKIIDISKNLEIISQFVPFELNKKALINKVNALLEKRSVEAEHYERTMELLSRMEAHLFDLTFDMTGDIRFTKITPGAIIKAVGAEFEDDYSSLGEKILDYMELVTAYDRPKLFVFINLRSYISDNEAELFLQSVLKHQYKVLLIENSEHQMLKNERRYIVDQSLCEIS